MSDSYDVIVAGAGPAGYVAAIRCAQLGLSVACIDERSGEDGKASPGGTCLNVGCIPSKALLDSSEQFARLSHLESHGITLGDYAIDMETMQARKNAIVQKLTAGIGMLFKSNQVTAIHGRAKLLAGRNVEVRTHNQDREVLRMLRAKHVILAPGSAPTALPGVEFDHERIVDSTGALAFHELPKKLGIIGAGVIGLELGSVWSRLGAQVVLLEALEEFLPAADHQIAREAARQFKKQGLDIRLGARVDGIETGDGKLRVTYLQQEQTRGIEVDKLIIAVGRRPATAGLFAADSGVTLEKNGAIEVDAQCRTRAENVWAIGDAVRGPMLAHKGSEEGMAVAERIAGRAAHFDLGTVPWVIYTAPEIAWVGQTEKQLRAQNIPMRIGAFPFAATGRALAMDEPAGMVKILAHEKTDRILGAHIIGAHASELIAECVLAMEYQASSEDLARTIHAHPTLSEAVHEAALAVDARAVHKAN